MFQANMQLTIFHMQIIFTVTLNGSRTGKVFQGSSFRSEQTQSSVRFTVLHNMATIPRKPCSICARTLLTLF